MPRTYDRGIDSAATTRADCRRGEVADTPRPGAAQVGFGSSTATPTARGRNWAPAAEYRARSSLNLRSNSASRTKPIVLLACSAAACLICNAASRNNLTLGPFRLRLQRATFYMTSMRSKMTAPRSAVGARRISSVNSSPRAAFCRSCGSAADAQTGPPGPFPPGAAARAASDPEDGAWSLLGPHSLR